MELHQHSNQLVDTQFKEDMDKLLETNIHLPQLNEKKRAK